MKCFCEKEMMLDELGDWDGEENEKVVAEEGERYLAYGVDTEGFYISTWQKLDDDCITYRPAYCPMCGRKLREEAKIEL